MFVGPCLVEFDAKIRISPHLKPKNIADRSYHISTGSSNCACRRGDLARSRNACESFRSQRKGTKRHCAVARSRSKTQASIISRAPQCAIASPTHLSFQAHCSLWKLSPHAKVSSIITLRLDAPSAPFAMRRAFGFSMALSLSHRSGTGGGWLCRALRPRITHWGS